MREPMTSDPDIDTHEREAGDIRRLDVVVVGAGFAGMFFVLCARRDVLSLE